MDPDLPHCDYVFKVVLVGDKSVGKSSIARKYTRNTFEKTGPSTIGAEFFTKVLEIGGKVIKLHIWDTAGQEQFRTIIPLYYRQAHGIMFVYDCTSETSFYNIPYWLDSSNRYTEVGTDKIIIGNKCDMKDDIEINSIMARTYAESVGIPFFETSAKDGSNIEPAFLKLITDVKERVESSLEEPDPAIELETYGEPVRMCC